MKPEIDISFAEDVDCAEEEIQSLINSSIVKTIEIAELEFEQGAELSVLIADNKTLQTLNSKWRNKDKPTNVLSFPTEVAELGKVMSPMLGDIAISLETARYEADLENKPFQHHLTHLIIHGFLHLFGYDHETDKQALQMESLETRILKELGIADPYQV